MYRLFSIIYAMAGPTMAGMFVTGWLVVPAFGAAVSILVAALLGAALAIPLAWEVTRRITAD